MLPTSSYIVVLWAASPRYGRPQMVTAWSEGLAESYHEESARLKREAKDWFLAFGDECDGPWQFWTTQEEITHRPIPTPEEAEAHGI